MICNIIDNHMPGVIAHDAPMDFDIQTFCLSSQRGQKLTVRGKDLIVARTGPGLFTSSSSIGSTRVYTPFFGGKLIAWESRSTADSRSGRILFLRAMPGSKVGIA